MSRKRLVGSGGDPYSAIFRLGLFLLPFDNLVIAPSAGWASICPFVFGLYFGLHFLRRPLVSRTGLASLYVLMFSFVYALLWNAFKEVRTSDVIDGTSTLFLGIVFYLSLELRYRVIGASLEDDIQVVIKGYLVSFFYGVVQFVALYVLHGLYFVFALIQKRSYSAKLQFSFTEPSFISIHVLGLMFVLRQMTNSARQKRQLLGLMVAFTSLSIVALASNRFLIDLAIVLSIVGIMSVFTPSIGTMRRAIRVFAVTATITVLVGTTSVFLSESVVGPRVMRIVQSGVYADFSLASRFFRINSSLKSYETDQVQFWLGNGFGGSINAMLNGFDAAFEEYQSTYTVEVLGILGGGDTRVFSLPFRIINEYGMLGLVGVLGYLLARALGHPTKVKVLLVVFWLVMQFDSYAHPLVWLSVFLITQMDLKRDGTASLSRGAQVSHRPTPDAPTRIQVRLEGEQKV